MKKTADISIERWVETKRVRDVLDSFDMCPEVDTNQYFEKPIIFNGEISSNLALSEVDNSFPTPVTFDNTLMDIGLYNKII